MSNSFFWPNVFILHWGQRLVFSNSLSFSPLKHLYPNKSHFKLQSVLRAELGTGVLCPWRTLGFCGSLSQVAHTLESGKINRTWGNRGFIQMRGKQCPILNVEAGNSQHILQCSGQTKMLNSLACFIKLKKTCPLIQAFVITTTTLFLVYRLTAYRWRIWSPERLSNSPRSHSSKRQNLDFSLSLGSEAMDE